MHQYGLIPDECFFFCSGCCFCSLFSVEHLFVLPLSSPFVEFPLTRVFVVVHFSDLMYMYLVIMTESILRYHFTCDSQPIHSQPLVNGDSGTCQVGVYNILHECSMPYGERREAHKSEVGDDLTLYSISHHCDESIPQTDYGQRDTWLIRWFLKI